MFFSVLPSSGISPCGWTDLAVMPPALGAALYVACACVRTVENKKYGLRLETQFSRDLETARFNSGPPGRNPPLYLRATVLRY